MRGRRLTIRQTMNAKHRASSGLENALDESACDQFLRLVGMRRRPPSLDYLTLLLRACYARIPFQNLSMLTGPRRPPTIAEITAMMLRGLGGPCDVNNFFLCALLHRLGFNVGLLPASMSEPDCHIGLSVALDGQKYWMDFGNGFPYLTPLPIVHDASAVHIGFRYQLEIRDGRASVRQNALGEKQTVVNQIIALREVHYSYFDAMRARHYGEPGFGPFLSGVRINRWELKRGFIMRDNTIRNLPGKKQTADFDAGLAWIRRHFDGELFAPLYRKSMEVLDATKHL